MRGVGWRTDYTTAFLLFPSIIFLIVRISPVSNISEMLPAAVIEIQIPDEDQVRNLLDDIKGVGKTRPEHRPEGIDPVLHLTGNYYQNISWLSK